MSDRIGKAGWEKPVRPTQQARPGGLPPKTKDDRAEVAAKRFAYELRRMHQNGPAWMRLYGRQVIEKVLAEHPGFVDFP
jgi:hypothetical protein